MRSGREEPRGRDFASDGSVHTYVVGVRTSTDDCGMQRASAKDAGGKQW
jgi:hypothetical protein